MILFAVCFLTLVSISLRFIIFGVDLSYVITDRVQRAVIRTGRVDTLPKKVAMGALHSSLWAVKQTVRTVTSLGLKILRFVIARLRDLLLIMSTFVLILDVVIFLIIVLAAGGYIAVLSSESSGASMNFVSGSTAPDDGAGVRDLNFTKYSLSSNDIERVARLCYSLDDSEEGYLCVASVLCNRYELTGEDYDSLIDYIESSNYVPNAKDIMDSGTTVPDDVLSAITNVINDGFRTIPGYIDVFNKFEDIVSIENVDGTNDKNDKSVYRKHATQVLDAYGITYTFYSFIGNADGYCIGYSNSDSRSEIGDDCYSVEEAITGEKIEAASGQEFLVSDGTNIDENYRGQVWELTDREFVELVVTREYGADYTGSVFVAQTIRDNMMYENTHTFEDIYREYGYAAALPDEPLQDAIDAVDFVFYEGGSAVQHRIRCYYASNLIYAEWQEQQEFVYQYQYCRFFDFDG